MIDQVAAGNIPPTTLVGAFTAPNITSATTWPCGGSTDFIESGLTSANYSNYGFLVNTSGAFAPFGTSATPVGSLLPGSAYLATSIAAPICTLVMPGNCLTCSGVSTLGVCDISQTAANSNVVPGSYPALAANYRYLASLLDCSY